MGWIKEKGCNIGYGYISAGRSMLELRRVNMMRAMETRTERANKRSIRM